MHVFTKLEFGEYVFLLLSRKIEISYKVRKAKSSEGWLRAIRKTIQLADAQTVLFFGLTPSSGALSFSKPFSKVARIPRPSSQKDSRIPPCRFLFLPTPEVYAAIPGI